MPLARAAARLLFPLSTALSGCAGGSDFGRHFDLEPWGNGLAAQFDDTGRIVAGSALLATAGVLGLVDHRVQDEATEKHAITEGSTNNGDAVAAGLASIAVGIGVARWIDGDSARDLEVLLESFALTEAVTEGLKFAVGRQRPSKSDDRSFPSGHTSFAFSMATFVRRWTEDHVDGPARHLGLLAYVPATYVGIDRVEANRHWPSDVAFGAFVGWFVTNVVYDAHYGTPGRPGLFGVHGLGIEPSATGDIGGIDVVLRF